MKITQMEPADPEDIIVRMTREDARMLAALADLPAWHRQPAEVAKFCGALHAAMVAKLGEPIYADSVGFTPHTSVTED
ncbi:hypothetical protein BKA00_007445 [Actinomadura coerulea]|uniref:Uncharacterized protein n=1 Tax=Actinomadura coerulea TaxID=46159 RepID=A0A7X0L380_9ACTN|nr:hypothetical protein [Actinomadura coerulea]MBB6400531.1 hypothetical protein [Actinomadura coerulea]GGQ07897.1 hypothetical protein GCM10010187_24990 [Actinomadura coerulea]